MCNLPAQNADGNRSNDHASDGEIVCVSGDRKHEGTRPCKFADQEVLLWKPALEKSTSRPLFRDADASASRLHGDELEKEMRPFSFESFGANKTQSGKSRGKDRWLERRSSEMRGLEGCSSDFAPVPATSSERIRSLSTPGPATSSERIRSHSTPGPSCSDTLPAISRQSSEAFYNIADSKAKFSFFAGCISFLYIVVDMAMRIW
eukprot:CAMPEP_0203793608 /NCGR_PEP_ID=MMETSP0100_2-20121128/5962_1 /ASSEMBLY_ACC=CAM_ASM_000210 /TAXON_ID=96639 /ORGANISM=" , Strain NY0313808BC1" /LENGTH=204 /DNA_ID=CAMNT_0050697411 /DNA_START=136 /DNA_END=747 /DNA_ORIENTATION=-